MGDKQSTLGNTVICDSCGKRKSESEIEFVEKEIERNFFERKTEEVPRCAECRGETEPDYPKARSIGMGAEGGPVPKEVDDE
jgi:hypothetical protein